MIAPRRRISSSSGIQSPATHQQTSRILASRSYHRQPGSYPIETRVGSRASDLETEFAWSFGGFTMKAVVLHEYGGPENLKFEDNVPEPQVSGNTVLIAAAAASVNPKIGGAS